jgi:hypothetical protein
MPLAGLVLNRVHGSAAARLSAERALAAAENLEEPPDAADTDAQDASDIHDAPDSGHTENLDERRIVDQEAGKAGDRGPGDSSPDADGSPNRSQGVDSVDRLTAALLRLHAERMQVIARERRTRERFTALHPEVAVTEVAALPGDVHDLAGLRTIGDRLAAGGPPAGAA